jgi:hypothetical protein
MVKSAKGTAPRGHTATHAFAFFKQGDAVPGLHQRARTADGSQSGPHDGDIFWPSHGWISSEVLFSPQIGMRPTVHLQLIARFLWRLMRRLNARLGTAPYERVMRRGFVRWPPQSKGLNPSAISLQ